MTLGIGDHVAKLDAKGNPIVEGEVHTEFEVEGYGSSFVYTEGLALPRLVEQAYEDKGFFTGYTMRQFTDAPGAAPERDPFVAGQQYQLVLLRKVK